MIKVFCWRHEPGTVIRWGEGDFSFPSNLIGTRFSDWDRSDRRLKYILQDSERDENGVYFYGSSICPNSDDPALARSKFYEEPLGIIESPAFRALSELNATTSGYLDRDTYTQAAVYGLWMIRSTLDSCRVVWMERRSKNR